MNAGAFIRAVDVIELRSNLGAARAFLGFPAVVYIDPSLAAGMTLKAAHIRNVRTGTKGRAGVE